MTTTLLPSFASYRDSHGAFESTELYRALKSVRPLLLALPVAPSTSIDLTVRFKSSGKASHRQLPYPYRGAAPLLLVQGLLTYGYEEATSLNLLVACIFIYAWQPGRGGPGSRSPAICIPGDRQARASRTSSVIIDERTLPGSLSFLTGSPTPLSLLSWLCTGLTAGPHTLV